MISKLYAQAMSCKSKGGSVVVLAGACVAPDRKMARATGLITIKEHCPPEEGYHDYMVALCDTTEKMLRKALKESGHIVYKWRRRE